MHLFEILRQMTAANVLEHPDADQLVEGSFMQVAVALELEAAPGPEPEPLGPRLGVGPLLLAQSHAQDALRSAVPHTAPGRPNHSRCPRGGHPAAGGACGRCVPSCAHAP